MKLSEFLRRTLMAYFIVVTCVTAATGIMGSLYEPQERFGYYAFFSPIIIGAIGILPSLVTYSKKELSLKQMLFRKVLQLIALEGLLVRFGFFVGIITSKIVASFAVTVFIIFVIVHVVSWLIDYKKADELTESLKVFQRS